jgi:hypothetical protein
MAFVPTVVDGFDNYRRGRERWTIGQEFIGGGFDPLSPSWSRHAFGQGANILGSSARIEIPGRSAQIIEVALQYNGAFQQFLPLLAFYKLDVSTFEHVSVKLSDTRHPYIVRGQNNALLVGPTVGPDKVLELGVWYWHQFYVKIHPTAGEVRYWINGNPWLEATGLNTYHSGASTQTADCGGISQQFGPEVRADDVVFQDGELGDFQGDMIVLGKRPAAPGYISEFTPVGAATGWEATNEINADEDTTYDGSDVLGARSSYEIAKITEVPDSSIVLAVQQAFRHRKDQPGPRSVIPFIRVASNEILGEERFPSETAYITPIEAPQLEQPAGGAWGTVGEFNALDVEVGQEVADGVGAS